MVEADTYGGAMEIVVYAVDIDGYPDGILLKARSQRNEPEWMSDLAHAFEGLLPSRLVDLMQSPPYACQGCGMDFMYWHAVQDHLGLLCRNCGELNNEEGGWDGLCKKCADGYDE